VHVTGDVAAAERDLREIWGGALCVSSAEHTQAELAAIQADIDETAEAIGLTSSSTDVVTGVIRVEVVVDDGTLQADYDERFGPDRVVVTSWLVPVG
jgi:hypothetical protein